MSDQTEKDLILLLATSSASLDRSPKKNWVENAGGLPPYIRKLARAISKNGHSLSAAIAIAISRVKVWAGGGGDVSAKTRAKAAKALAAWEALKAKNAVKLTHPDGEEYIMLSSISSFNTDIVRSAWEARQEAKRKALGTYNDGGTVSESQYSWIEELGTDYIITSRRSDNGKQQYRIPYSVNEDEEVEFGSPKKIIHLWVEDDDELSTDEALALSNIPTPSSAMVHITEAAKNLKK